MYVLLYGVAIQITSPYRTNCSNLSYGIGISPFSKFGSFTRFL